MCSSPFLLVKDDGNKKTTYEVPCGRCYECVTKRRSMWTVRNLIEYKHSQFAYFVTLTYNDDYIDILPYDERANLHIPRKAHYQNFLKRLRKKYGTCVRYFGCSEYGGETYRPHYHIILYFSQNVEFNSSIVRSLWPYGFITLDKCNNARIHYTTKYVLKVFNANKLTPNFIPYTLRTHRRGNLIGTRLLWDSYSDEDYRQCIISINSFNFMSLKPAIGYQLLEDKEYISYYRRETLKNESYPNLVIYNKHYPMPRYYINKIFTEQERTEIYNKYRDDGFSLPQDVKLSKILDTPVAQLKKNRIFASVNKIRQMYETQKAKKIIE